MPLATVFDLLPPEMVMMIWRKYLGKNDLLNSRLVSKSWNEQSLTVLKNSNFVHILYGGNGEGVNCLEKFLKFAANESNFVLPFGLNNLNTSVGSPILDETRLREFLPQVEILTNIFCISCVRHFDFYIGANGASADHIVSEILIKICDGVETLTLRGSYSVGISGSNIFKTHPNLQFPKLISISINYFCTRPPKNEVEHNEFWETLVQKSPSLKNFVVKVWPRLIDTSDWYWPVPMHLATSLRVFYTMSAYTTLLQKLPKNCHWPLTKLDLDTRRITFIKYPERSQSIADILTCFASPLIDLRMSFMDDFSPGDQIEIPFPKFPRLKYFEIYIHIDHIVYGISPQLVLDNSCFPVLEEICLPFDMLLIVRSRNWNHESDFPCMTTLTLDVRENLTRAGGKVPDLDGVENLRPYKEHLEYLQEIFCNIKKIKFRRFLSRLHGSNDLLPSMVMGWVLKGLIESNWAAEIQEVQFHDCFYNYLGTALSEMAQNRLVNEPRLKKLRRIVLHVSKKAKKIISRSDGFGNPPVSDHNLQYGPKELFVELLTQNSPFLKEIHVSSRLLGKCNNERAIIFQELSNKFPRIIFKIT